MRMRMLLSLLLITAAIGPASAQTGQRGGIRTETMNRLAAQGSGNDLIWNLIGLLGLVGLLGLGTGHPDDSYHPSSID
ncbi:MAG: WGxxGxxG family protein [Pseudomonadota bacterium]